MKNRLVKIAAAACLSLALPLSVMGEPTNGGGPRKGNGQGGSQGGSGGPNIGTPGGGGGGGGGRMDGRGGGGPGGLGGPGGWESAEEREKFKLEVETFLKAHSPKRWEDFKAKNDRGQDHNRLVWSMAARYRGLQMLEKDDKPLYDIKVKQIEIEDTEFGLRKDLDKATGAAADKIKGDLRDNAKQYVEQSLAERGIRIKKLSDRLELEKQALVKDTANPASLISDRYDKIIKEGPDFFGPKQMRPRPEAGGESPGAQKMKELPGSPVTTEDNQ